MISEYHSDEEFISQLRMFFTTDESEHIDFPALLGQIRLIDDTTGELKIKGRCFHLDLEYGNIEEVNT